MNQYEKVSRLQKLYYGNLDFYTEDPVAFFKVPASELHSQLIETRSHTFDADPTSIKNGFQINTLDDYTKGYGYHNLRIVTDLGQIEKIDFHAGGSIIDVSYPSILKNYTPFSIFQENVLPALEYHNYHIYVNCTGLTQITYDVVKMRLPKNICKCMRSRANLHIFLSGWHQKYSKYEFTWA